MYFFLVWSVMKLSNGFNHLFVTMKTLSRIFSQSNLYAHITIIIVALYLIFVNLMAWFYLSPCNICSPEML